MTLISGIKEEILIQRLNQGDQTAFELLFRFYYPGLVTYASQIILDPEDAEEIVQDFFVRLWVDRQNLKNSLSIKNYLFTSVKNRSLNFLKKMQISEKVRKELSYLIENDPLYDQDVFITSELQKKIKDSFDKLPPRTHEIFSLSRHIGLTNDEIATKLNLSKRTVETQISNALKIFREELRDYMFLLMLI
jgi:RNA polymerase sigma-70 factor, ECF subfamily